MVHSINDLFDVYGLNLELREWFDLKTCLKLKVVSKVKLGVWEKYEVAQVRIQGKIVLEKLKVKESCYLKFSDFSAYMKALRLVYEIEILLEVLGIIFK